MAKVKASSGAGLFLSIFYVLLSASTALPSYGQLFHTLHTFGDLARQAGIRPYGALVASPDGTLYGSTSEGLGGGKLRGAIYKVSTNGSAFAVLKQFTNNFEGGNPRAPLLLDRTTLYGLTTTGGSNDGGTLFKMNTDGSAFAVLVSLPTNSYGLLSNDTFLPSPSAPVGGLTLVGSNLFGATRSGGRSGFGTIFSVSTNGENFVVLKEFTGSDGAAPYGDLLVLDSVIFGVTSYGGTNDQGTLFRMNLDGSGFTTLKQFGPVVFSGQTAPPISGAPGIPFSGLVSDGAALYGTTSLGGDNWQNGTVFKIQKDGSGFEIIKSFSDSGPGRRPAGRLLLYGNRLVGTTSQDPASFGSGPAIFLLSTDATDFRGFPFTGDHIVSGAVVVQGIAYSTSYDFGENRYGAIIRAGTNGPLGVVHIFTPQNEGPIGPGPLTLANGLLYGTTALGSTTTDDSAGTLFRIGTTGNDFEILHTFADQDSYPQGHLTIDRGTIYGAVGNALYSIETNAANYHVLHYFTNSLFEGNGPVGAPVLLNGTLYGTTQFGGPSLGLGAGSGTVYKINPDGSGYEVLKTFRYIETNGVYPRELTVLNGAAYGITSGGGAAGVTTLFRVATNGDFAVVHRFDTMTGATGRLLAVDDMLYGTLISHPSVLGPTSYQLFRINENGTDFSIISEFTAELDGDASACGFSLAGTNLIGVLRGNPAGKVASVPSNSFDYGATPRAAKIFQVDTNGSQQALIYELAPSEGTLLNGDLIVKDHTAYGTAYAGGDAGRGLIFSLDLRPRLSIDRSGSHVVVSWPAYAATYSLQQSSNVVSSSWTDVEKPGPQNGTFSVPIAPSAETELFRLSRTE